MTSSSADEGRRRARAVTWTLVAGATVGATAVAGVAAASSTPGRTSPDSQTSTDAHVRHSHAVAHDHTANAGKHARGDDGERDGNESDDGHRVATPAPATHHRHHRARLAAPTSSQPSATSSGS